MIRLLAALLTVSAALTAQGSLLVLAGAASKPPAEELGRLYQQRTGVKVEYLFGGSGYVLAQMRLARRGDLYFPGSSDFMELAKKQGMVVPETERRLAYLVPAINVPKGNPKGIRALSDLTRPGLRIAIANPETVCVGTYAVELLERQLTQGEVAAFRRNLINYTDSCEKTATAVALGTVDAVLGWSVFQHWDPRRIETIPLPPHQIVRFGYLPIAVATCAQDRRAAQAFIDFLASPEGRAIFARHHYFTSAEEAAAWAGATRPVGGRYELPSTWLEAR